MGGDLEAIVKNILFLWGHAHQTTRAFGSLMIIPHNTERDREN